MSENEYKRFLGDVVDGLVEGGVIYSEGVEAAFRAVPRHLFLPGMALGDVYQDRAIPTKMGENGLAISSSSQPAMMAIMLEQLALVRGERVLEIGAGTGFNAALMGYIVGVEGRVTTIDIDLDIVEAARDHLALAGCRNVTVVCGDGTAGFPEHGLYDAIILTVGGWDIVPAWLEQLKPDGRLLLPLSLRGPQLSIVFERAGAGLVSRSVVECSFMRLRGEHSGPTRVVALTKDNGVGLGYEADGEGRRLIDVGRVAGWLAGEWVDTAVELMVKPEDIWRGLNLWLALNEPGLVTLWERGESVGLVPGLIGGKGAVSWWTTFGLVGEGGMAVFVRPSLEEVIGADLVVLDDLFELMIRGFGTAEALVERLRGWAVAWDENGRRGSAGMRVRAFPVGEGAADGLVVERRWFRFVVDWVD